MRRNCIATASDEGGGRRVDDGADVQPWGLPRFHKRESIIAAAGSIGGGVRNYRVQADGRRAFGISPSRKRPVLRSDMPRGVLLATPERCEIFRQAVPLAPPFCCSDPAHSAVVEDRTGKRSRTPRGKAAGSHLFCRSPMFNVSYDPFEGSRLWSWVLVSRRQRGLARLEYCMVPPRMYLCCVAVHASIRVVWKSCFSILVRWPQGLRQFSLTARGVLR